jgi:nitrite reductase (NADH) small subunit
VGTGAFARPTSEARLFFRYDGKLDAKLHEARSRIRPATRRRSQRISLRREDICIANVNGVYSAMDNVCLHRGGPLGQGMIEGGKVICPWHGWAYDPKTGVPDQNPSVKVAVYPFKIENGDVLIEI